MPQVSGLTIRRSPTKRRILPRQESESFRRGRVPTTTEHGTSEFGTGMEAHYNPVLTHDEVRQTLQPSSNRRAGFGDDGRVSRETTFHSSEQQPDRSRHKEDGYPLLLARLTALPHQTPSSEIGSVWGPASRPTSSDWVRNRGILGHFEHKIFAEPPSQQGVRGGGYALSEVV